MDGIVGGFVEYLSSNSVDGIVGGFVEYLSSTTNLTSTLVPVTL